MDNGRWTMKELANLCLIQETIIHSGKHISLALFCLFLAGGQNQLFAQNDKQAEDILKSVSARYKSFTSVKADFTYTSENPKDNSKESQTGSISIKGEKYVLEIKGQEVMSDGKTIWTYLKESNEVQISEPSKNTDAVTPSNIFTMYEKGFDFKFIEEKTENGKQVQIIDIKPQDAKKNYFKIRLTIDKSEKMVNNTMVFDKSGSHYIYSVKQFTPNPVLSDALFTFDKTKHPGVEIVDLR